MKSTTSWFRLVKDYSKHMQPKVLTDVGKEWGRTEVLTVSSVMPILTMDDGWVKDALFTKQLH